MSLDADRDGDVDLVVGGGDHQLLLATESGFEPGPAVHLGPNPGGLATADFDGDGWADLAVANHETDQLTVLLGGPDGRFRTAPGSPLRPGFSPHPHTVAAGDLNGDGHPDLLVDDRDSGAVLVIPGDGQGSFGKARRIAVGGDPYRDPWLGDLDGDGRLDLVTPNERALAVLRGDGSGGFEAATPVQAPRPFGVTAADVNGDGALDLASIGNEGQTGITVLLGDGSGGYGPASGSPVPGVQGPGRMASGDVNGDGYDDLVAGPWPGEEVLLVLGGADRLMPIALSVGRNPWSVVVADLDGDGRLDIVTANEGSGDVTVFWNRSP